MSVTKQLLDVFRVDKLLRGLRSRLEAAERFLSQQAAQLAELEKQKTTLETQAKQLKATIANEEGEAARLEARIAIIREQMNSAKTAKEYNAFLTELNTYKDQKGQFEEKTLGAMSKVEEIDKTLSTIAAQHGERVKIVGTARSDRDLRESEIKDRVAELQAQRDTLTAAMPAKELNMLEQLIKARGDEAMAPIEVLDRRAHEGSCSACMMAVPVEAVSALMGGKLVTCPNCRCILYIEEETFAKKKPGEGAEPKKPRVSKKTKKTETEEVAKSS